MTIQEKIEIIREEIILSNNPECKTYEEALIKESEQLGANILYRSNYKKNKKFVKYTVGSYDNHSYTCFSDINCIDFHEDWFIPNKSEHFILLGLPMTLERLLVALQARHNILRNKYATYTWLQYSGHQIGWVYARDNNLVSGEVQIPWIPNKTLEEQSEETIEKIYNILF